MAFAGVDVSRRTGCVSESPFLLVMAGFIKTRCQMRLGNGHAYSISDALSQWAGGGFNIVLNTISISILHVMSSHITLSERTQIITSNQSQGKNERDTNADSKKYSINIKE